MHSKSLELCRYLIDQGAWSQGSPFNTNTFSFKLAQEVDHRPSAQIYRLSVERDWMDLDFTMRDGPFPSMYYQYTPNAECLLIMQQSMMIPYLSRSLEERFAHAMMLDGYASIDRLIQALGGIQYVRPAALLMSTQGQNLLHVIAKNMPGQGRYRERGNEQDRWRSVLRDTITAGADLHGYELCGTVTPLVEVLGRQEPFQVPVMDPQACIEAWAKELLDAGVDLAEYGERELKMWEALPEYDKPKYNNRKHMWYFLPNNFGSWRVDSFVYGPKPSDWRVVVRQKTLVKVYELQRTPGAWVSSELLLQAICWESRERESQEGHWNFVRQLKLDSDPWYSDELIEERPADFSVKTSEAARSSTQDDCSEAVRLTRALRKWRCLPGREDPRSCRRSRSTSPRGLRRWRERYGANSPFAWTNLGDGW